MSKNGTLDAIFQPGMIEADKESDRDASEFHMRQPRTEEAVKFDGIADRAIGKLVEFMSACESH